MCSQQQQSVGLEGKLAQALAGQFASAVDIGSGYTVLEVSGEKVRDVISRGCPLDRLRIRAFPFHSSVASFVAAHDFVFVIEQNRDAQLRSLVINECSIDPVRLVPILHYDGTPITARLIARSIGDHVDALKVTPLRKVMS